MSKKQANPTDRYIGARVRMKRMALGLSQEKLGDTLGVTFQQIQKYENATNRIGAGRLQQIAQFLHVPVSYFYEGAPSTFAVGAEPIPAEPDGMPEFMQAFMNSRNGMEIARSFVKLDTKLQHAVRVLVEQMAEAA